MSDVIVEIPSYMQDEMNMIKKSLSSYPGHKTIANSLGKFCSQKIVAGLVGCIVPESGSDPSILNSKEYRGSGAPGTEGWNCGEGLIQWTYWKYKLPLIRAYNADSRSTQKLPTTWEAYKQGEPISKNGDLYARQNGQHISGLNMDNHMLFLTKYYAGVINQLENESNLAVIVAKIYQQKAGPGFYTNISDPVERAYTTSKYKYPSSAGNHYLQSLKVAMEYIKYPVQTTDTQPLEGDTYEVPYSLYASSSGDTGIPNVPNTVYKLASASRVNSKTLEKTNTRKQDFEALRDSMVNGAMDMGRDIITTAELYDSNILKGTQESRTERV